MPGQRPVRKAGGLIQSPIPRTFGIRYLEWGPGWLEGEFKPAPRFANASGFVQGGVLSVFLDNLMGQSAYTLAGAGQVLSTAEMSLHYLEPAPLGLLKGSARVVKRGRQIFFVEGEVRDSEGRPLVRARATLLVLKGAPPVPGLAAGPETG